MEKFAIWLGTNVVAVILGLGLPWLAYFPFVEGSLPGTVIAAGILLGFVIAICIASSVEEGDYKSTFGFVMMYIFMGAILAVSILAYIFEQMAFITIFWAWMPIAYFLWRGVSVTICSREGIDVGKGILLMIGALIFTALIGVGLGYLVSRFPNVMIYVNPGVGLAFFILTIVCLVNEQRRNEY